MQRVTAASGRSILAARAAKAMGLEIKCEDDDAPIPRRTFLTLQCDVAAGFFCRGVEEFHTDGYIEAMSAAKRAGWVERNAAGGRIFVCKDCS